MLKLIDILLFKLCLRSGLRSDELLFDRATALEHDLSNPHVRAFAT